MLARTRAVVAVTGLVVAASAGCTSTASTDAQPLPHVEQEGASPTGGAGSPNTLGLADGSTVLVGAAERGGVTLARISGRVVPIGTSCWGFDDGQRIHALVVDHGSSVGADGLSVVTPQGMTIAVGDELSGGSGGGVHGTGLEEQWRAALPECLDGRRAHPVHVDAVTEAAQQ